MGGHAPGGATAAAVGQVAAVGILYAFPVGSFCCFFLCCSSLPSICTRYIYTACKEQSYLEEFWYIVRKCKMRVDLNITKIQ